MTQYTEDDLVNIIKGYDNKTTELLGAIKDLQKQIEEIKQTIKTQVVVKRVVDSEPRRYC